MQKKTTKKSAPLMNGPEHTFLSSAKEKRCAYTSMMQHTQMEFYKSSVLHRKAKKKCHMKITKEACTTKLSSLIADYSIFISEMMTGFNGISCSSTLTALILSTTSMPSSTFPKIVYLPSISGASS